jgi:hypothetical protein
MEQLTAVQDRELNRVLHLQPFLIALPHRTAQHLAQAARIGESDPVTGERSWLSQTRKILSRVFPRSCYNYDDLLGRCVSEAETAFAKKHALLGRNSSVTSIRIAVPRSATTSASPL